MDRRYEERVALLVQILPVLDSEPRFALKGGTAINLFEHDLPRLSVDIDLTWLSARDYDTDAREIDAALRRLAQRLSAAPLRLQIQTSSAAGSATITRVIASRGRARVQIETTPVMRGVLHPPRRMQVCASVERRFGFAATQVVDFRDLYAGKLAAALSRQHPRDLFDVRFLIQGEGIPSDLWRSALIYLSASPKPAADLLAPNPPRDFREVFVTQFAGMTREPVSHESLLDVRERLLDRISERLDADACAFLRSMEQEVPQFDRIGLPQAAGLPEIARKLHNLSRRSAEKREADWLALERSVRWLSERAAPDAG